MFVGLGGGSPFKLLRNADLGEGMTAGLEGGNTVKPRAPGNTSHHDSRLVVVGWWGRGYITCHVGTLFTESCKVLDAMQQVTSLCSKSRPCIVLGRVYSLVR